MGYGTERCNIVVTVNSMNSMRQIDEEFTPEQPIRYVVIDLLTYLKLVKKKQSQNNQFEDQEERQTIMGIKCY